MKIRLVWCASLPVNYRGICPGVAALLVAGCSIVPASAESYRNVSSLELCRQYLTLPSYNIHHAGRAAELARRGETCGTTPAGAAAAQRQTDQRYQDAIQALQPPPPPPVVNCTTTYVGQQAYTTCR